MQYWFIDEQFFAPYQAARASGQMQHVAVSAEKLQEIRANADRWAQGTYASENLVVENGVARIQVSGVMLSSATVVDDYYAHYFGETYTTYPGMIAQIRAAEANPFVESVEFVFDTPGGMMAGVDEAARAIAGCEKPTKALIPWMAASAGYYLASQCGSIVATSPSSSVGSIGVVVDLVDTTALYEKWGVKFYSLTSTKAPKKRQEPHSEEFKTEIIARLDALHSVFAQRVAEGRSRATGEDFTEEGVNENFGSGGLVIAKDALEAGMIDAVENEALKPKTKEKKMAETTTGYTAEDIASARAEGATQERARVTSLLPFMEADSASVTAAIKDGSELTGELQSSLMEAVVAQAKEEGKAAGAAEAAATEEAAAEARETEDAEEVVSTEEEGAEAGNAATLAELREGAARLSTVKPKAKKENI